MAPTPAARESETTREVKSSRAVPLSKRGAWKSFMLRRMRQIAKNLAREARVGRLVLRDPRTPWPARILLAAGVAYALSPIDLIPDFIPVLGHLDDAVVVPLLLALGLAMVSPEVIREHRQTVMNGDGRG
ncbi:MAG: DUF1232 domain-containing protein [Candidatus Eisenbacteria bacterium]|uniref:DUF1232 domain-containing protein n=1 Tax=Eiseniibacteriota bacterium TaxID=2212470 RepID=A0A538TS74_UNCEI|nr:MAG: DUF1232 domain-containing protein [Candidatus Eisenbacteria bacterium]